MGNQIRIVAGGPPNDFQKIFPNFSTKIYNPFLLWYYFRMARKKKIITPLPTILDYTPAVRLRAALRAKIRDNALLPVEKRLSRYELFVSAGYPESHARALTDMLVENDKFKHVANKGFDADSAKLVIQEIAHDPLVRPEQRLRAAEDMLKVLGLFREGGNDSPTSTILAQLLRDMFKASETRPKIIEVENLNK